MTGAPRKPIVIAHRGASGYRPEHTLAAYQLALEQGADFIEPDLVATLDGALICRHENALAVLDADGNVNRTDTSTDVFQRPEFRARETLKSIDGRSVRGWFCEDFTLAEIKTLRAIERLPALRQANCIFDGKFEIPTFDEVLDLLASHERATGHRAGVYPETKHPSYFATTGCRLDGVPIQVDLSRALVDTLCKARFTDPTRVFIQSFEVNNLRELARVIMPRANVSLPLIQLMEPSGQPFDAMLAGSALDYRLMSSPAGLAEIATYAQGIGPHKSMVIPRDDQDRLGVPASLLQFARAVGLAIHAWTFRAENFFLPAELRQGKAPSMHGDLLAELRQFMALGLDGVFCDYPDLAVRARDG